MREASCACKAFVGEDEHPELADEGWCQSLKFVHLPAARPCSAQKSRLLARPKGRAFGSSMRVRLRQEDAGWGGRLRQRAATL